LTGFTAPEAPEEPAPAAAWSSRADTSMAAVRRYTSSGQA